MHGGDPDWQCSSCGRQLEHADPKTVPPPRDPQFVVMEPRAEQATNNCRGRSRERGRAAGSDLPGPDLPVPDPLAEKEFRIPLQRGFLPPQTLGNATGDLYDAALEPGFVPPWDEVMHGIIAACGRIMLEGSMCCCDCCLPLLLQRILSLQKRTAAARSIHRSMADASGERLMCRSWGLSRRGWPRNVAQH